MPPAEIIVVLECPAAKPCAPFDIGPLVEAAMHRLLVLRGSKMRCRLEFL